jgi:hypothetical protein
VELVAVQPVAGQVDLRLDRAAVAQDQHPGQRWERVQVDVPADPGAEQPGVRQDERGAGDLTGADGSRELLGQPQPQVHAAAARVRPGSHAAQQQPGGEGGDEQASWRQHEQQGADQHGQHRDLGHRDAQPAEAEQQQAGPGGPAQPGDGEDRQQQQALQQAGAARDGPHGPAPGGLDRVHALQQLGQGAEPRPLVDVRDGHGREAAAQAGHELGGGQAAAAVGEEVLVRSAHRRAEHGRPLLGHPARRALQQPAVARGRQRPRQGGPVDLAGGPGRQRVDLREDRHERGRQGGAQPAQRRGEVEALVGDDVADQHGAAARCRLHRRRAAPHVRQRLQRRVHLAQLDAPAAQLDLVVRAAEEQQPSAS